MHMTLMNSVAAGASPRAARRTLARRTDGVAFMETAFVLPIMLLATLGGLEIGSLMLTHTRVSAVALAVADNASRIAAGSKLSAPQVREVDVNDVFAGAILQAGDMKLKQQGRIILSSVELNADGGQWIHWQRCFGDLPVGSSYGREGLGASGTGYAGMGETGREVKAGLANAIMFVEVNYDYRPFIFKPLIGAKQRIFYNAAFAVRDPRDTSAIFNPSPAATVNSCKANDPNGAGRATNRVARPWGASVK